MRLVHAIRNRDCKWWRGPPELGADGLAGLSRSAAVQGAERDSRSARPPPHYVRARLHPSRRLHRVTRPQPAARRHVYPEHERAPPWGAPLRDTHHVHARRNCPPRLYPLCRVDGRYPQLKAIARPGSMGNRASTDTAEQSARLRRHMGKRWACAVGRGGLRATRHRVANRHPRSCPRPVEERSRHLSSSAPSDSLRQRYLPSQQAYALSSANARPSGCLACRC